MTDRAQDGMTLIEVLVALAVVSAVAAGIMALIAQNTRFIAASEERLAASLAADAAMVEALARLAPLERGVTHSEVDIGARRFIVTETVTEIGVEQLVRIDIVVRGAGEQSLAAATTIKPEDRP